MSQPYVRFSRAQVVVYPGGESAERDAGVSFGMWCTSTEAACISHMVWLPLRSAICRVEVPPNNGILFEAKQQDTSGPLCWVLGLVGDNLRLVLAMTVCRVWSLAPQSRIVFVRKFPRSVRLISVVVITCAAKVVDLFLWFRGLFI